MGYERRGASFNFVGFVPIGKTIDVVPDTEEHPALIRSPRPPRRSVDGTVAMSAAEFARDRAAHPRFV
jgi:hypothetical protein